ncbi:MAG: DegV family protein [Clostridiales bacterium]|nr:DegV family protein [Clostridiales bacterium]
MAIKIITDSTSDIPQYLLDQYDISIAPLTVNFSEDSFKDNGIDLPGDEFFLRLKSSTELPTTSQVSPGEFVTLFEEYLSDYDEIICINLSSDLSGTYNAAVQAKNILNSDKIHMIDSRLVSFALGMVVLKSAKMAKENKTVDEIISFAKKAYLDLENIFVFDTLEYLLKGGRLSKKEAFLGNLLNIKPILTIIDGNLKSVDKVRGRKKAIKYAIQQIKEDYEKNPFSEIAIYESSDSEMAVEIKQFIEEELKSVEIFESKIGIVVGTHAGPGCAAISYFK